jgi:dolichyl-phosphate beta-glucosyltransferase
MQMDVVRDPSARRLPLIDSQVEALWMHRLIEDQHGELRRGEKLAPRFFVDLGEVSGVQIGHDQQMPGVVRVQIEEREAAIPSVDDVVVVVLVLMRLDAKHAAVNRLGFVEIRHAPRRPQLLHGTYSPTSVIIEWAFATIWNDSARKATLIPGSDGDPKTVSLSIVIPAYNEARRLPSTIRRLREYLGGQDYSWEIIVVANGCTDGTAGTVRGLQTEPQTIRLLELEQRGKGLAARSGALASCGDVVFLCDADLSMPPERLETFMQVIECADVVAGSREAHGARRFEEPWHRHVMGRVFNRLVQLVAVPGIHDTQCGFKAFRRGAALDLFGQQTVVGWGFDVELLFLARRYGYVVEELGIDWFFDADTRVRPGIDTLQMLRELIAIRLRNLRGQYRAAGVTQPTPRDSSRA